MTQVGDVEVDMCQERAAGQSFSTCESWSLWGKVLPRVWLSGMQSTHGCPLMPGENIGEAVLSLPSGLPCSFQKPAKERGYLVREWNCLFWKLIAQNVIPFWTQCVPIRSRSQGRPFFLCVWPRRVSSDGKESACNAGELGSIPGSGRSPGGGNENLLQYPLW